MLLPFTVFKAYYDTLTTLDIKYSLSEYAVMLTKEFLAKSFAGFMCAPSSFSCEEVGRAAERSLYRYLIKHL